MPNDRNVLLFKPALLSPTAAADAAQVPLEVSLPAHAASKATAMKAARKQRAMKKAMKEGRETTALVTSSSELLWNSCLHNLSSGRLLALARGPSCRVPHAHAPLGCSATPLGILVSSRIFCKMGAAQSAAPQVTASFARVQLQMQGPRSR